MEATAMLWYFFGAGILDQVAELCLDAYDHPQRAQATLEDEATSPAGQDSATRSQVPYIGLAEAP